MVRVAAMHVNRGRRYRTFQEYLRAVRMTRLMLRSFLGPFAVTFPVALFILDMQFLWVYADELIGKGLDAWIILKLMVFASARLVNLALPLAVLVASIMSMGNLAERSEMTALKASGTSYLKMIRPLVLCMALISGGALWFSNRGWPAANIKFRTLLYSVTRQKPALNVREGVFYNGIEGFSIRVQTKHPDGRLEQVLIHDHRDPEGKRLLVVKAESGQMRQEQGFLVLELNHGVSYEEHQETMSRAQERVYPHVQSRFERQTLRIPLNSLDFSMANQDLFRKSYEMMTLRELAQVSDSLSYEINDESQALGQYGQRQIRMLRDTTGWFAATATSGKSSSISSLAQRPHCLLQGPNLQPSPRSVPKPSPKHCQRPHQRTRKGPSHAPPRHRMAPQVHPLPRLHGSLFCGLFAGCDGRTWRLGDAHPACLPPLHLVLHLVHDG